MITVIVSLVMTSLGAPLGQIDLSATSFSIHRANSGKNESFVKVRDRVPLFEGDEVTVPAAGGVKGVYNGTVLVLRGPAFWTAPKKGAGAGASAGRRILGRTDMGSDEKEIVSKFVPFVRGSHATSEFYVDGTGAFRFAWATPKSVQWVEVSASVGGKTVGPFRHECKETLAWTEDVAFGTQLRREFMQESKEVSMTLHLHPSSGTDTDVEGYLVSREKARVLDKLTSALDASFAAAEVDFDNPWYENLNAILVATDESFPATNAYWVVKAWSKHKDLGMTNDALKSLLAFSHLKL